MKAMIDIFEQNSKGGKRKNEALNLQKSSQVRENITIFNTLNITAMVKTDTREGIRQIKNELSQSNSEDLKLTRPLTIDQSRARDLKTPKSAGAGTNGKETSSNGVFWR